VHSQRFPYWKPEARSQKPEGERRKAEARSQKPEARSPKPEDRSQNLEVRSKKPEAKSQKQEARSKKPEFLLDFSHAASNSLSDAALTAAHTLSRLPVLFPY